MRVGVVGEGGREVWLREKCEGVDFDVGGLVGGGGRGGVWRGDVGISDGKGGFGVVVEVELYAWEGIESL